MTGPFTFVYTGDLADYLAQAVNAPVFDGEHIDIGWTRPVTIEDIANIASQLLQTHIRATVIPGRALSAVSALIGWANPTVKDMAPMFRWFQSGNYVADTTRQQEVFGQPPTPEAALGRFITELGHHVGPLPVPTS